MTRRRWAIRQRWARSLSYVAYVLATSVAFAQAPPANPTPSPVPAKRPEPQKPPEVAKSSDASKVAPSATDAVVLDATSLDAVIGRSVKSRMGEDMGRIVDILVPTSGQVRAAVIDFGGFLGVGTRRIAVDWGALNFNDVAKSGNIIVALTRNQVRMAPEYKQDDPIVLLEATEEPKPAPPPPKPSTASASQTK